MMKPNAAYEKTKWMKFQTGLICDIFHHHLQETGEAPAAAMACAAGSPMLGMASLELHNLIGGSTFLYTDPWEVGIFTYT